MKPAILLVSLLCGLFAGPAMADPINPDPVPSLLAKSRTAEGLGRVPEAILYMQAALVADPARASTYVALGDIHIRVQQDATALHYYEAALDVNPWEPGARRGMERLAQHEQQAGLPRDKLLDKN